MEDKKSISGHAITNASKDRPNIARLVQMMESQDKDGKLFPAFISLIEMSFHSHEHGK